MNISKRKVSNFLEVEYKYRANRIDKYNFLKKCLSLNPCKNIVVTGPDTYYENKNGSVLRWRLSEDLNELTIKKRFSKKNSLVRKEVELDISDNSVKNTIRFINTLGYKKLFRIYKECNIFWYNTELGQVCVVYYTVSHKTKQKRNFIEIEVEKGQNITVDSAKKLVKEWENKLSLNPNQRINSTLLELYSDKKTEMVNSDNITYINSNNLDSNSLFFKEI